MSFMQWLVLLVIYLSATHDIKHYSAFITLITLVSLLEIIDVIKKLKDENKGDF